VDDGDVTVGFISSAEAFRADKTLVKKLILLLLILLGYL
jgi:hypothetical protein